MSINAAELRGHFVPPKKKSKYGNRKTIVDGIRFDSQREAYRWRDLRTLENAGRVRDIRRQVRYSIRIANQLICQYVADFVYEEYRGVGSWVEVVEDAKGVRTPVYRLKRKLMKAVLGLEIRET